MPRYVYGCGGCGNFERFGRLDDDYADCPVCHNPARRRPFSGIPNISGETVAKSIPDPLYRQDAEKRELNQSWGDGTRSMEMLRNATFTDAAGIKQVDLSRMK